MRDFLKKVVGYPDRALSVFDVLERVGKRYFAAVAGLVGSDQRGLGVRRRVVGMREKGDQAIWVVLDLAPNAGEEPAPDSDPARHRVRGCLVGDHACAAEVDIAVAGDEFDGRRSKVDRKVLLDYGLVAVREFPQRAVLRADTQYRGSFHAATQFRRQVDGERPFGHRPGVLFGDQRDLRAADRERRGDRLQSGALIADANLHRRQAQHLGVRELDAWSRPFEARREVIRTACQRGENDQNNQDNRRESFPGRVGCRNAHVGMSRR